jgi:hypothetical protein
MGLKQMIKLILSNQVEITAGLMSLVLKMIERMNIATGHLQQIARA